jgi:hypothetical protein
VTGSDLDLRVLHRVGDDPQELGGKHERRRIEDGPFDRDLARRGLAGRGIVLELKPGGRSDQPEQAVDVRLLAGDEHLALDLPTSTAVSQGGPSTPHHGL